MSSTEEKVDPHILKRFKLHSLKGVGAYGIVWRAIDRVTDKQVAIKKCYDIFLSQEDTCRMYREIILLHIIEHKNVVKMIDVIPALNEKDIYLIFEYVSADLHQVIQLDILGEPHFQFIIYQILCCLKYLHSGKVIHRDLKPSNILIDSDCNIKVADFGQARSMRTQGSTEDTELSKMSGYIATRWYRAPEIVFEDN